MTKSEFIYTVLLKPPFLRRAANAAIRRVLPNTVAVGDATIWINPNHPVVSGALTFGVYERDEISFFGSHFSPGMIFIDVGANVGLYTGIALSIAGTQGRILAIEPHAESRQFLDRTIESNSRTTRQRNVDVCDCAIGERFEKLKLFKNSQNKGDNRLYADPLLDDEEIVTADTLDHVCERYGIETVQFLKIDVQGTEAKVIGSASQLLQRSADCILMTEFWPYGLERCGSDSLSYLELLGRFGFTIYELRAKDLVPVDSPRELIARTQGRKYANLIGLKGRFTTIGTRLLKASTAKPALACL